MHSPAQPLRVGFRASGFNGSLNWINGAWIVFIGWGDLVRAAVTVGYPSIGTDTNSSFHQRWANRLREAIVYAYLRNDSGSLVRTDVYKRADPSEKGAISYYLGLFGAKLIADRILGAPFLQHFDSYRRLLVDAGDLRTRPDLVGHTWDLEWFVVEAKGRSGAPTRLWKTAKAQAQSIGELTYLDGTIYPLVAQIASVGSFPRGAFRMEFRDPPVSSTPLAFSSDGPDFWRAYYQPIRDLIQRARQSGNAGEMSLDGGPLYWTAYDPIWDVTVGVLAALDDESLSLQDIRSQCEMLQEGLTEPEEHPDIKRVIFERLLTDTLGAKWSVGSDGVIVSLGARWNPSLMQLEPERRGT